MNEITEVNESIQLIQKDLGLEENIVIEDSKEPFERLEVWLEKQIRKQLDTQFSILLNALYRIDIPEQRVKEILELSAPDEVALNLARAIIDRERQKVITRRQYRQP